MSNSRGSKCMIPSCMGSSAEQIIIVVIDFLMTWDND